MSILKNAIQAIQTGIEDYDIGTEARLKSAIRNVHAGALLLFKEKLSQLSDKESDEALIKQRILPKLQNGKIKWRGKGKKTVDTQAIKERFESLGVSVGWNKFDSANTIRNDIEHYYTTANIKTIQEALAKLFGLITEFCQLQLKIDLKDEIGDALWAKFVSISEVYEQEKSACIPTQKYFKSHSETLNRAVDQICCSDCGSDLIKFNKDGSAICRSCSEEYDREQTIVSLTETVFDSKNYMAVKDGGELSTVACPECGEEAFIGVDMICASCGESQKSECIRCAGPILIEEIGGSMCSYCTHMTLKDD